MKTALLAVHSDDKNDALADFARTLNSAGWHLMGSAGTARFLNEQGIVTQDIGDIVGPPILGHKVVTLAREVHAGLLASPEEFEELERLNIRPIGLVYVTLYPLEKAVANPNVSLEKVREMTDIGGPTMLRAAAKGRRIVLSRSGQLDFLAALIKSGDPDLWSPKTLMVLAAQAERRVADYVRISAEYLEDQIDDFGV